MSASPPHSLHAREPQWSARGLQNHAQLRAACAEDDCWLYGLIDAAVDDSLYARLQGEPESSRVTCLFDGIAALRYRNVAPYLMHLHRDSPLAADWLDHGWAGHWGVWMASVQPLARLKTHLKKLLFVKKPGGARAYFRFYDPRVLDQVMPILSSGQCGALFGLNHKPMPSVFMTAARAGDGTPRLRCYRPEQNLALRFVGARAFVLDEQAWR